MRKRNSKTVNPSAAGEQLLKVAGVARYLNVSKSQIYQMVKSGTLPSHRIGNGRGVIRFRPADIEAYTESSLVANVQPLRQLRPRLKHIHLGERSPD